MMITDPIVESHTNSIQTDQSQVTEISCLIDSTTLMESKQKTEPRPYKPKSKNQEHLTPDEIYTMIEQKWGIKKEQLYDPCPAGTPYKAPIFFNGLYGRWQEYNYVNPMYDKKPLTDFVHKSIKEIQYHSTSFLLVPTKTDQAWFQLLWTMGFIDQDNTIWINHRLRFKNNKNSAPDTHLLVRIGI